MHFIPDECEVAKQNFALKDSWQNINVWIKVSITETLPPTCTFKKIK